MRYNILIDGKADSAISFLLDLADAQRRAEMIASERTAAEVSIEGIPSDGGLKMNWLYDRPTSSWI